MLSYIKNIFFIILLLLSIYTKAQCPPGGITLYSQGQVDNFIVQYPNCTQINGYLSLDPSAGGNITNLNGLQNITTITGSFTVSQSNSAITSIAGMNNLTYVGGSIILNDSWITNISSLQNLTYVGGNVEIYLNHINDFSPLNNITHIGGSLKIANDSGYCSISGLDLNVTNIPGDLIIGEVGFNDGNLNGFSSITQVGGKLRMEYNNVADLSGLASIHTIGGRLELANCPYISSLSGINTLTSLGGLSINSCNSFASLAALSPVTSSFTQGLWLSGTQLNSLSGLNNITSISGTLRIDGNTNLTSINQLSGADLTNVTNLIVYENFNLALCNELNICNYLFNGGTYQISNNATGCSTYTQLIGACNLQWKNLIQGSVKIDTENNGCGVGNDLPMGNILVKAVSGSTTYSTFTDAAGDYQLFVPQGAYTLQTGSNAYNFATTPASYSINFAGVGNEQIKNFCAAASQIVNDVRITIIPSSLARPGFDVGYYIYYENIGTTVRSGSINFTFDGDKMSYVTSIPSITSQSAGMVTWNYSNLMPFEDNYLYVKLNVLPPPTVNGGTILPFSATINPVVGDATPSNNVFSMNQIVVNSFDPNDKTVLEGNSILLANIGNYLNYVVRFQNTGSASAINIKILDTLESKLDASTFELIGLSHPGRVQLINNVAEFTFDNINLPDSTSNEPDSHGYIAFRIKPKSDNVYGNILQNTASIYFDFNAPIITNTTATFIDSDTDNDGIYTSVDNCPTVANTSQTDLDGDGIGDSCDDNVEVNPPYFIGFDTATLDPLWKGIRQASPFSTDFSVSNLYDVDGNGKTIKLFSNAVIYSTFFVSPRLNNVSANSIISFWVRKEGGSSWAPEIGFMKNQNDPSTFVSLQYLPTTDVMTLFTLNMSAYTAALGKNLAIRVRYKTIYIDDFNYQNPTMGLDENQAIDFFVYPNPVSNVLNVNSNIAINEVIIYDLNGRVLKTIVPLVDEEQLQVNIDDLSKGLYFIEVKSNNKKQTQKFIKK